MVGSMATAEFRYKDPSHHEVFVMGYDPDEPRVLHVWDTKSESKSSKTQREVCKAGHVVRAAEALVSRVLLVSPRPCAQRETGLAPNKEALRYSPRIGRDPWWHRHLYHHTTRALETPFSLYVAALRSVARLRGYDVVTP